MCGEGGEVGDAFEHREQGCASDDRRDDGVGPAGVPYPTRGGLACVRGAEAAVVAEAALRSNRSACFAALRSFEPALTEAQQACALRQSWLGLGLGYLTLP